jgi:hypothetical protein
VPNEEWQGHGLYKLAQIYLKIPLFDADVTFNRYFIILMKLIFSW